MAIQKETAIIKVLKFPILTAILLMSIAPGIATNWMIKIAMIQIQKWLNESDLQTKMILQVHDELLFDVPRNEMEVVRAKVKELMEGAMTLNVPILVETGIGDNWLEAH